MRKSKLLFLVGLLALNNSIFGQQRIFMIGDSTMADKDLFKNITDSTTLNTESVPFPDKGWGQMLPLFFGYNLMIENHAKSGSSSKSFIQQGRWQEVINRCREGDYLIIQFGHNDTSKKKGDRYSTPDEYTRNLTRFVREAKLKKSIPIICTPVARRSFDIDGRIINTHGEYLDLVRNIAKKENILLVDMYEKSRNLLEFMGVENSKSLFLHFDIGENKNYPNGNNDNTHFNVNGAYAMAELFIIGLKEHDVKDLVAKLKVRIM